MKLILRWIASAAAVGLAIHLLPGLDYDGRITTLFVVAVILGLVNAIVRPIVKMLACGIIALTLGLALLVINAAMLYLTSFIAGQLGYGFHVLDFRSAVLGSLIISIASWFLSLFIHDDKDDRRR
ncbi:MAG TPA: phage holin family protein [Longimicrobium sp.]|jgi:putative membrane protein|uniref:phage holin family protein n=1 Tax=Longimicrobium sp. TaxID=2029185 RepID=UPI002EDAC0A7